mmetsp:Transcript_8525/g.14030  ORF Transcript_8525/g.14030 Transcript_8525/m.14030 type:complete len:305 (-) Transcript_8525:58-972(-)
MSQSMSGAALKLLSTARCFGGYVQKYEHASSALGGLSAKFSVYLPEKANSSNKVPVIYWLSGLTCTEDNFIQKAGAQQYANELGIALVAPDTSPRTTPELEIKGEHDSYDFGSGAGFYVNATQSPWNKYYQMYDYINCELPSLLRGSELPLETSNASILGHSMGGHGALVSYLRLPSLYKSVSAFSPICNPINCRWGQKCFGGYLGAKESNLEEWKKYDATELVQSFAGKTNVEILIDQGAEDGFLYDGDDAHNQLLPENFVAASKRVQNVSVNLRWQPGYDHSYYFIASFIRDHLEFHAQHLQ